MKYIYLPLERIDSRYTKHLDRDILAHMSTNNIDHIYLYPEMFEWAPRKLPEGMFLDAPFTIGFKNAQLTDLALLYYNNKIDDGDIIFASDLWFPGLCESVAYLNHFCNKRVKIRGIIHAGSWVPSDSVAALERWAKGFEDNIFDIVDLIYVGSQFIKKEIIQKRICDPNKIVITPLPLDVNELNNYLNIPKKNFILFNGRNHPEKQPELFRKLAKVLTERYEAKYQKENPYLFILTCDNNFTKNEYYGILSQAKAVVSFALQENFGYGIAEAAYLGCIPVVPNRLVYPEFYPEECLYNSYEEAVEMVWNIMETDPEPFEFNRMQDGNLGSIHTWFKQY